MIYGIGIDIIEVERVKKQLVRNVGLKEKIFTDEEITYCESKRHSYRYYAARFAAKEAFFKALGTGWRFGFEFKEIEIRNNELGKPEVVTYGKIQKFMEEKKITNIHISISHIKSVATAYATLEY